MSEQVLRNGNAMARSKTRTVTQIAMLGAIAGILMNHIVRNVAECNKGRPVGQ